MALLLVSSSLEQEAQGGRAAEYQKTRNLLLIQIYVILYYTSELDLISTEYVSKFYLVCNIKLKC